ncbi:uncharacterized protein TRIADDRAFT_24169, partial [Trichoplax adhaerens]
MLKRSPTCKYCGKSFSSNSYLKAHIRVHEIPDSFRCPECNKLFSLGEDESGKNYYECEICNKQFTSLTYMKAHVKMHNQPSSCVCKFCSKPFSCISAVNKH